MKPKLSIIILSWNTKVLILQCLESVVREVRGIGEGGVEIIVVDNESTDGSVNEMQKSKIKYKNENVKFKIIENKENLGYARGNNIGIKQAEGEYIMLLNPDTIIREGAIEKLVEFLDKNPNTVVSPMLFLPDGKSQTDYYMRFPNLWQVFLYHNSILRPIIMRMPFLSSLIAQKPSQNPLTVDQLPGTALLAHSGVWDKVGLLDEEYRFLFEDVDWCWRAKKIGIKLMVVPQAKIVHFGGASWKQKLKKDSSQFYYQFFSSMLLFVKKNYSKLCTKIFKWAIITSFLLTLKPLLAWRFIKSNGRQKNFLLQ